MTYQKPDKAFIDYDTYNWGRLNQVYRGPKPDFDQPYIACLGAAQTFGRYVNNPFPAQLADMLGVPVANLGTAGAGPGFFLRDSMALEAASNAELCVIQVMSARSLSNRMFQVRPKKNAQLSAVSKALSDLFPHVDFETFSYAHNMLNQIAEEDPAKFIEVERELKTAWDARTRLMLESIHTKKILFWFSERAPNEEPRNNDKTSMLKYPHYVDQAMLDAVTPFVDKVVYCISNEGMPQSLLIDGEAVLQSPFGMPVTEIRYYPSPEMHQQAAEVLARPVYDLLKAKRTPQKESNVLV
ncbi:MAG: DUF6473 family protein [Paracoccaceae bacterium]|jgi:hypothetical protein|nr:DUF6473 family protein [Paracoccaceae bacterium]